MLTKSTKKDNDMKASKLRKMHRAIAARKPEQIKEIQRISKAQIKVEDNFDFWKKYKRSLAGGLNQRRKI